MFFVPKHVDATKGAFLVMTDHGYEGWGITSQHESAEDALLSLAEESYGRQMIVQITEFKFAVTAPPECPPSEMFQEWQLPTG